MGPGTDYLSSCVWADGGDSWSAVLRNPARWADGGDFRKPVSSQSKVLPDRKNSIQSPTGPQKFNPKSYRTAKNQSKVLPNRRNTKMWRKFRNFFIYLPPSSHPVIQSSSQGASRGHPRADHRGAWYGGCFLEIHFYVAPPSLLQLLAHIWIAKEPQPCKPSMTGCCCVRLFLCFPTFF